MVKLILIGAFSLSLLMRVFLILNGKHVADIWHIAQMGNVLLMGKNPYLVLDFNIYPPLSIAISAVSTVLSNITNIPFHIIIKIWPNVADYATAFVIYKYLKKQKIKTLLASLWTSLFLLNPISVIISAAHGQLDSIASFLVIIAIYYLNARPKISALALGLSIAVKPNPLILLPLFILTVSAKNRIRYFFIVILPLVLTLLPFLISKPIQIIKGLLSYSGIADFGYAAILRGLWFQNNANANLPMNLVKELLESSKIVLIVSITVLTLLFGGWKNLAKSALAIYLLFISLYFGIGAQYLSWIIPLAIMAREKLVIVYTLSGTVALIGFYLYFGPDLLLGKLVGNMLPFENKYIYYYFYGNLIFWISCILWLTRIITKYSYTKFHKSTATQK